MLSYSIHIHATKFFQISVFNDIKLLQTLFATFLSWNHIITGASPCCSVKEQQLQRSLIPCCLYWLQGHHGNFDYITECLNIMKQYASLLKLMVEFYVSLIINPLLLQLNLFYFSFTYNLMSCSSISHNASLLNWWMEMWWSCSDTAHSNTVFLNPNLSIMHGDMRWTELWDW